MAIDFADFQKVEIRVGTVTGLVNSIYSSIIIESISERSVPTGAA